MKLIITGALGHIGSALFSNFLKDNSFKELLLIDNLSTYRYCSLFNIKKKSGIKLKFLNEDIINLNLNKLIKKNDIIIHLAAISNAEQSFKIKKKVYENNFFTTKKIVDIAVKKRAKCIFISSTSVYGSKDEIMYEDTKNNLNPQSPYARCKILEEKYIIEKIYKKGLTATILRLGTIYGTSKGMRFYTVVNKFCWQAFQNIPLTVWKTAYLQKRPYLDINDAISCIKYLIKKNIFDGQIYNVATNNLSVKLIIQIIKKFKKIRIKLVKNKIMNQLSYEANCDKIIDKGFKFKGNIQNQIRKTINLFRAIDL